MKVSLILVTIVAAASVAADVSNDSSNPRHLYLKAKSTKVSKSSNTKSSKSKASKSSTLEPECTADTAAEDCPNPDNLCTTGACNTAGVCIEVTAGDGFQVEDRCDGSRVCCSGDCCPENNTCENGACTLRVPELECVTNDECSELNNDDGCVRGECNNEVCESVLSQNGNQSDGCDTECCNGECCAEGQSCFPGDGSDPSRCSNF